MNKINKKYFYSILLGATFLSHSVVFAGASAHAGAFLDHFEEMFATLDHRQQSLLVKKPISLDVFEGTPNLPACGFQNFRQSFNDGVFSAETTFPKDCPAGREVADRSNSYTWNQNNTNALGLAIVLGRPHTLRRFLGVVENPNSLDLSITVFRQQGSLAHVALDPFFPDCGVFSPLDSYLETIDILGRKGVNFNSIPLCPYYTYRNPPLVCQRSMERGIRSFPEIMGVYLRARALLYGADPRIGGSSFSLLLREGTEEHLFTQGRIMKQTLAYYCERLLAGEGQYVRMIPAVKERLGETARYHGFPLERFEEFSERTQRLRAKIENRREEIGEILSPESRAGKRRSDHLNGIVRGLESELASVNRHWNRFYKKTQK
jgi:hypothetical protein